MRRLRALIRGLPPGGALHRAVDPKGWAWTNVEELLAGIAELVDYGNRLFFSANRAKKSQSVPKAIKIKRPYESDEQHTARKEPRRQATDSEIRSFFRKGKR